jgi:hypothetical protein
LEFTRANEEWPPWQCADVVRRSAGSPRSTSRAGTAAETEIGHHASNHVRPAAEQLSEMQAELSPLHDRLRYIATAVERLDNSFYARPEPRWWEMGEKDPLPHWRVALKWARFLGVKAVELAVILSIFASLHDRLETIIVAMAGLLYCAIRRVGNGMGLGVVALVKVVADLANRRVTPTNIAEPLAEGLFLTLVSAICLWEVFTIV